MRTSLRNQVTVLTGAASGIGAALASDLAARGSHLALIDRDAHGLARIAGIARGSGVRVSTHCADLADAEAIPALTPAVLAEHSAANLLINNAGVAVIGGFAEMEEADFDWLMRINFWAGVRLTRAFLPALRAGRPSRIVFLSSVFGLVAPPWQSAYAASKFAIRGFAESLSHELVGSGVDVTVVHPGGIRTGIARSARVPARVHQQAAGDSIRAFDSLLRTSPETAARIILDRVERGAPRVLVGADAYGLDLLARIMPVRAGRLLARRLRRTEPSGGDVVS